MTVFRSIAPALLGTTLLASGLASSPAVLADPVRNDFVSDEASTGRARVIDAEPIYRTVSYTVPRQQCSLLEEPVRDAPRYNSYTGPILGAVIGGAIGNAVGHSKTNKKVGTAVGAVLGGSIGRDIQHRRSRQHAGTPVRWESRKVCETVYETREREEIQGYQVTYRYAGQTYRTHLAEDPGPFLRVRVQVTPA